MNAPSPASATETDLSFPFVSRTAPPRFTLTSIFSGVSKMFSYTSFGLNVPPFQLNVLCETPEL